MSDKKATAAQLKHDIDSGRTGDKVRHPDPAAAPLGTDEEAGGAPLQPSAIAEERIREGRIGDEARGNGFPQTAGTSRAADARRSFGWPLVILVAVVIVGIVYLLLRGAA